MKTSFALAALPFSVALLGSLSVKAESIGDWNYAILSNKMSDERFPTARLRASNGAILSISCQGYISTKTKMPVTWFRVHVHYPDYLGETDGFSKRTSLHRFDDAKAEENDWSYVKTRSLLS
jgi:hypothetical protein